MGRERAVIRVGGAVEAKFLESCALDADGPVRIRTSILSSTIHTKDIVEMSGERGMIIGGIVKAQNGVSAVQIGTERGPRTEIHCGIDFKVEQKLVWIRDRNISLAFKVREIESKMKSSAKARDMLAPLREKIRAAIHQLNENARSLVSGLDRNERAAVSVRGEVYPGHTLRSATCCISLPVPDAFFPSARQRKGKNHRGEMGKSRSPKGKRREPSTKLCLIPICAASRSKAALQYRIRNL